MVGLGAAHLPQDLIPPSQTQHERNELMNLFHQAFAAAALLAAVALPAQH